MNHLEFIDKYTPALRVGTDCSGIEAPIQALRQLKIPFKHIFASEIDKYCIKSIKANYNPEIIFGDKEGSFHEGDITKRNIKDVPNIDLYVCGFPCQPFSQAGKREGFKDKRGNVFWSCLEVIEVKQPKYFILENVLGLLSHNKENKKDKYGRTWNVIWNSLIELEKYGYTIKWKVLNTRDYGIPQNRERIFIVGIKEKDFVWPNPVEMEKLENYIDWEDNNKNIISKSLKKILKNIKKNSLIIDSGFQYFNFPNSNIYSPCLTSGHSSNIWCVPKQRLCNIKEWKKLQDFSMYFNQNVSNTKLKNQLGNSMSVNVLKCLFKESLKL